MTSSTPQSPPKATRLRQSTLTAATGGLVVLITLGLAASVVFVRSAMGDLSSASDERVESLELTQQLTAASDQLTENVRQYAITTDRSYLDAYWDEVEVTQTRDHAVARLEELGTPAEELALIEQAMANSDALIETETRAMRLVLEATGASEAEMPAAVAAFSLTSGESARTNDGKLALARDILFDETYDADKAIIAAPIEQFQAALETRTAAAVDDAQARADLATNLLVILVFVVPIGFGAALWLIHTRLGKVVVGYVRAIRERDTRDTTFRLEAAGTAELHDLADAFNEQFGSSLSLLAAISEVSDETARQAESSSATSQQVSANVSTVATAVEEMTSSIGEIAKTADEATNIAARAVTRASSANETVSSLGAASEEIGKVIEVITSIAEQTNLLALNATIEAARAGEAGKGFAVVANEVKELAKETSEATEQIASRIAAIQSETGSAVDAIGEIATIIDSISELQSTIAAAVEEQQVTTAEISRNVHEAAKGSEDIARGVSALAQTASSARRDDLALMA